MGLIRSGNTKLTPEDDDKLTTYLWPIVREMIKTAIENFEDMKKIQDYFIENKQWNFYLLFTLNINTVRRIEDLRQAKWSDFFYKNGNMKKYWDVQRFDKETDSRVSGEKKTHKIK